MNRLESNFPDLRVDFQRVTPDDIEAFKGLEQLLVRIQNRIFEITKEINKFKSGTADLSSGTADVELDEPDDEYRIILTGDADETFYFSSKTQTGFTINSSNGSSTATVDWQVTRDAS